MGAVSGGSAKFDTAPVPAETRDPKTVGYPHLCRTLGVAPSEILLGYHPTLHPDQNVPSSNQTAEQCIEALHQNTLRLLLQSNKVANQGHTPEGQSRRETKYG